MLNVQELIDNDLLILLDNIERLITPAQLRSAREAAHTSNLNLKEHNITTNADGSISYTVLPAAWTSDPIHDGKLVYKKLLEDTYIAPINTEILSVRADFASADSAVLIQAQSWDNAVVTAYQNADGIVLSSANTYTDNAIQDVIDNEITITDAANGLGLIGKTVELGINPLNKNTTINLSTFNLLFNSTTGSVEFNESTSSALLTLSSSSRALRLTNHVDPLTNIISPEEGMIAYNLTDKTFEGRNDNDWLPFLEPFVDTLYMWVSASEGNDSTAIPGFPNKPYQTINAAITEVLNFPNLTYVVIHVSQGTYNESITSISSQPFGIEIHLHNAVINGRFAFGATKNKLVMNDSTISDSSTSNTVSCANGSLKIEGKGVIEKLGGVSSGQALYLLNANNCLIEDITVTTDGNNEAVNANAPNRDNKNIFRNCKFLSETNSAVRTSNSDFINCEIKATNSNSQGAIRDGGDSKNKFYNCEITNEGSSGKAYSADVSSTSSFYGCYIDGGRFALDVRMAVDAEVEVKGCTLRGGEDAIDVFSLNDLVNYDYIIENCKIFAGTGNIFDEPASYTGTRVLRSINNMYNKAFTPSGATIVEHNKYEI